MDDRVWRQLKAKLAKAEGAEVRVGVLASKGGDAEAAPGFPMTALATVHEYGSPRNGIPERSFIRSTFEAKAGEVGKITERLARGFVEGKISLARAYEVLGTKGAAMVKATIASGPHIPPPLKPATVKAKGSDRPLVDTGALKNAISYEVVAAGEEGRAGYRK